MKKILVLIMFVSSLSAVYSTAQAARCKVELQTFRGRTLNTFIGRDRFDRQEACYKAKRKCRRELRRRQDNGRNPYASCVKIRRQRRVRCSIDLVNRRGRVIDSFTGVARERRRACMKARRQCRAEKERLQTRRGRRGRRGGRGRRNLTCQR
ncbi:MAG: hypothetical protein ISR65_17055 [Bacteriovoracaceae bacterium]|nr:hypothetical protein [Bacteriovoracaceae bacterium]